MGPHEYLRLFQRRWWVLAGVAFIGAAFAWLTAPAAVAPEIERYQAVHTLLVEPAARSFTPENPSTIALFGDSPEVPRRVAGRLGITEDEALGLVDAVAIVGDGELGTVRVTSTMDTAAEAELAANTVAEELVAFLDEQEDAARQRDIVDARTRAQELEDAVQEISRQLAAGEGDADLLEEQRLVYLGQYGEAEARHQALLAEPAADSGIKSLGPARADRVRAGIQAPRGRTERSIILGTLGLLLAAGVVVALERLDIRIKTKEEAEAAFRLPVIAEIPQVPFMRRRTRTVFSHTEPSSSIAEAYRGLRTTLLILKPTAIVQAREASQPLRRRATDYIDAPGSDRTASADGPVQVFLVTSTRPSEGKTTTIANLAAAFAEAGRTVLVIGADVRRPEIHEYFGVAREPGVTNVLAGGHSAPRLRDVIVQTAVPGVSLAPSGPHVSNPGELLLAGPDLLEEARALADVVLVDTTPMLTVNDAVQLMPGVDCVILTCRAGRATAEAARRTTESLARLRVPVAGVVLVEARETPGVSSYYYGYQAGSSTSLLAALRRRLRRDPRVDAASDSVPSPVPTGVGARVDLPEADDRRLVARGDVSANGRAPEAKQHEPVARPADDQPMPDPWGWP